MMNGDEMGEGMMRDMGAFGLVSAVAFVLVVAALVKYIFYDRR